MMGVPLDYHSYAFGDNCIINQQSNIAESKLMKCQNMLAFHCIGEAIASGIIELFYIPSNENPAGLLMKFLAYQEAIPYLCPLLFWCKDMSDISMWGRDN